MEIDGSTRVADLKTQRVMDLESAIDNFGIIDIQLLDFTGSIFVESKNGSIQSGFNRLFVRNEIDNESILLEHKLKLTRFMRNFQHQEAMTELDQILKFGESDEDKFTEFRYTCLKGRILMRWRKFEEAKKEFEAALTLIETKFSYDERNKLIDVRISRMKPSLVDPNWDTNIIDYDEILLGYLYSYNLFSKEDVEEHTRIFTQLSESLKKAEKYYSYFDIVIIRNLLSLISLKIKNYEAAKIHLEKAIQIIDEKEINHHFYEMYGSMHLSLAEVYASENEYEGIILKLDRLVVNSEFRYYYFINYRLQLLINKMNENIEDSFDLTAKFIDFYLNHKIEFADLSPLFVISDVFTFVIQGIKLNKFKKLEDASKYTNILNGFTKTFHVSSFYLELILIRFELSYLLEEETNAEDYVLIGEKFEELLEKTKQDPSVFILVVLLFYEFLALSLDQCENAKNKIQDLSIEMSEVLNSNPYMIMMLVNESIKYNLVGGLKDFKNKLYSINENYKVKEIIEIIQLIEKYENGKIDLKEYILEIISSEIHYSKFENLLGIPVEVLN